MTISKKQRVGSSILPLASLWKEIINMKKISIAIPIFNLSKYLRQCIRGFTLSRNIGEIVIHDDGSEDRDYK